MSLILRSKKSNVLHCTISLFKDDQDVLFCNKTLGFATQDLGMELKVQPEAFWLTSICNPEDLLPEQAHGGWIQCSFAIGEESTSATLNLEVEGSDGYGSFHFASGNDELVEPKYDRQEVELQLHREEAYFDSHLHCSILLACEGCSSTEASMWIPAAAHNGVFLHCGNHPPSPECIIHVNSSSAQWSSTLAVVVESGFATEWLTNFWGQGKGAGRYGEGIGLGVRMLVQCRPDLAYWEEAALDEFQGEVELANRRFASARGGASLARVEPNSAHCSAHHNTPTQSRLFSNSGNGAGPVVASKELLVKRRQGNNCAMSWEGCGQRSLPNRGCYLCFVFVPFSSARPAC